MPKTTGHHFDNKQMSSKYKSEDNLEQLGILGE